MRIRSLTYAGKLRADVETICMGKTKSQILTLLQNWHPLPILAPSPILVPSNSGNPFNFSTPSISGVPGGRFHRPSLDKADAVLENSFPVWLRFPLASPRARASSNDSLTFPLIPLHGSALKFANNWERRFAIWPSENSGEAECR